MSFSVVESKDSLVLSKTSLYLIMPCVILQAFQAEFNREVRGGLLLARVFGRKRIYFIAFLRMIACPARFILLMKLSQVEDLTANGDEILLITFLATMTPAASTITQFAQIFHNDAEYAGAINILTTLFCIITMPVFVALYSWL